jgi:lantibiotic modifying enzyme
MQCTREFLAAIVEKSALLYERLEPRFVPRDALPDDHLVRARMARWLRNGGLNSPESFEKRLAWDGLTPQGGEAIATGVRLADPDGPLPRWTGTLRQALLACDALAGRHPGELASEFRFLKTDRACAFEHLMVPFVSQAGRRVRARFPSLGTILAETAMAGLERYLLRSLCLVAGETLALEFAVFKAVRQQASVFGANWTFDAGAMAGTKLYDAFVEQMWTGGLLNLFAEYTVLARLLPAIADMWVDFVVDFLSRFEQDLAELRRIFNNGEALGRIVEAEAGLSDRHNHGLTAIRVRFEAGPSTIYKPKNLDSERAYYKLLSWFNGHGAPLPFLTFHGVYRSTHGWVQVVEAKPCESEAEVERYFQRTGILLGLVYVLEGSDCHLENIIAAGEYPALIDMETLVQGRRIAVAGAGKYGVSEAASRAFLEESVFRTDLLPRWLIELDGTSSDISGLGGVEKQAAGVRQLNVVRLNGKQRFARDYIGQIVDGFQAMYRFLMEQRAALWAAGGPLTAMRRLPVRTVYRATRHYAAVQRTCLVPQFLRDGMDTSIQVEVLGRPLLDTAGKHPFWPVHAAEHAALLRADIPLFWANTDSTALALGEGRSIPGFFTEPGIDLVKRRFSNLNAADLDLQVGYIRSCFDTGAAGGGPTTEVAANDAFGPAPAAEPCPVEDLVAEAVSIAARIERAVFCPGGGSTTWLTLAYYPDSGCRQLQPMEPRLYDGICGTALFLAAVEAVAGGAGYRTLAISAFKTAAVSLEKPACTRELLSSGIGAGLGCGSLVYGYAVGGALLAEESLFDNACRAARLLTPQRIDKDRRFDLLCGAAGALVALLTLYRTRREPWLVDSAVACGEHLLRHRTAGPLGARCWKSFGGADMGAGFSQGAAGIAYALNRLAGITCRDDFREAAAEAWEYVAGISSEGLQGAWCDGAPGIGLGRVGGYPLADANGTLAEIEREMAITIAQGRGGVDHLCCGVLGRADVLLTAGRTLNRADWQWEAQKLGAAVVERARQTGRYELGSNPGTYLSSFHQGMAGVGYELLRLADPDRVPSVLLWE